MARKKTSESKKTTKRAPPPFEAPEHGVTALAEEMGVEPATVRVKLRAADGLKKEYKKGRAWDFRTAANLKKVAKQLAA